MDRTDGGSCAWLNFTRPMMVKETAAIVSPDESHGDVIIEVTGVDKAYQRWRSPSGRLFWGIRQSLIDLAPRRWGDRLRRDPEHYYESFYALRQVSLQLRRGQSLGVIGRNGSGKSTLLQIIAGTLRPTSGSVQVRGRVAALLELGSGFNPEFTGKENVYFNAAVLGMDRPEIEARYSEILRFADIGDFISQPVKTYSSGMTLRLAFAVAVHANADILIVDEALAVGDVFFQQKCYRRIRELMDRGTTFLLVSHDYVALQNLCQHGIILEEGQVIFAGDAEQCAHRYMRQAFTIGERANNRSELPIVDLAEPDRRTTRHRPALSPEFKAMVQESDILPSAKARHGSDALELLAVALTDAVNRPVAMIALADEAYLSVLVQVNRAIKNPEIAFRLIDRLGNTIFCTCNSSLRTPLGNFEAGQEFGVRFKIRFAVEVGHYTFTVETGKQAEDRPNMGIYFQVAEGIGPFQVYDPAPTEIRPFYGMAQLPCQIEKLYGSAGRRSR